MPLHLFFLALFSAAGGSVIGAAIIIGLIRRHEKRPLHSPVFVRQGDKYKPLDAVVVPKGVMVEPVGDQIVLYDDTRKALLVGENDRGGYGFKSPGELHWHGNYATLEDAVRACGRDCFKAS